MQYAPTNFISSNLFLFLARGPHVCRLKRIKFVGKVVLFERSELTTFPLSKFNHFQETRQSWGVLSFAYFSLHKQRKVRSPSAKPISIKKTEFLFKTIA